MCDLVVETEVVVLDEVDEIEVVDELVETVLVVESVELAVVVNGLIEVVLKIVVEVAEVTTIGPEELEVVDEPGMELLIELDPRLFSEEMFV